jgi:hypothetical protein
MYQPVTDLFIIYLPFCRSKTDKTLREKKSLKTLIKDKRWPRGGVATLKRIVKLAEPKAMKIVEAAKRGDIISSSQFKR